MPETRSHVARIDLAATPERVFRALVTPSAIRDWWSAARAIVVAEPDGRWSAAWGEDEDAPQYVTSARIRDYVPPSRLVLDDYRYWAAGGPLPFTAEFTNTFEIHRTATGARLVVTHDGFPADPVADDYLAACVAGWRETLGCLRRHLEGEGL